MYTAKGTKVLIFPQAPCAFTRAISKVYRAENIPSSFINGRNCPLSHNVSEERKHNRRRGEKMRSVSCKPLTRLE
jgi:hypothetical protein